MLVVTGSIAAKPEAIAEMLRVSREHVHRSREEPGCISIDVATELNLFRATKHIYQAQEARIRHHLPKALRIELSPCLSL